MERLSKRLASVKATAYIILIIAAGFLTFANMLPNSFVWDDEEMVVNNAPVFHPKNIPAIFSQASFYSGGSSLAGWFYRPFVTLSFLVIHTVFGLWTPAFHFIQLVLHIGVAVVLFFLFEEVFKNVTKQLAKPLSGILSLVFVVHPAHVEAVSYIATFGEPLYVLFSLVLLLTVVKSGDLTVKKLAVSGFLFFFALMTKEGAIVLFPITLLWLLLNKKRSFISVATSLSLALAAYLLVRVSFFGIKTAAPKFIAPIAEANLYERFLTGVANLFFFLKLFFFPRNLSIAQHYVVGSMAEPAFLYGVVSLVVIILLGGFFVCRKYKIGLFFVGWFMISFIPVLNIFFPLDMSFAERWLYFPMIGVLGAGGCLISKLRSVRKHFAVLFILGLLASILLSWRTIVRNANWKDGFTLYSHDIEMQEDNFDLENNLGVELFRKGRVQDALYHVQRSVQLRPQWAISNNNLGAIYQNLQDLQNAQKYYRIATELDDYYLAYVNLSLLLARSGDLESATDFLDRALKKFPGNADITMAAAITYHRKNDRIRALDFARRALLLENSQQNLTLYRTILENKTLDEK